MSTPESVIATRLFAALRDPQVANQAGATAAAWASTAIPRVFRGLGGFIGGRNRGRCPFIEFEVQTQTFKPRSDQRGLLSTAAVVRAHVCVGDLETAGNLTSAILSASLAAIRSPRDDLYLALGTEQIQKLDAGPWGHQRDVTMTIEHSFDRTYEIQ